MAVRRRNRNLGISLAALAAFGVAPHAGSAPTESAAAATPPAQLILTGIVRDFRERTKPGGHPDFEATPVRGFGHYCDNVSPFLGEDKKPAFKGGGFRVGTQWRDASGRPICWRLFDPSRGDQAGSRQGTYTDTGGITSAASFSKASRP